MWRVPAFILAVSAAVWSAGAVVAAGLVAAAGAYIVARRTSSGSVRTADAATLFMELRENRKELIAEIGTLRTQVREGQDRERTQLQRIAVLENEVRRLGGHISD